MRHLFLLITQYKAGVVGIIEAYAGFQQISIYYSTFAIGLTPVLLCVAAFRKQPQGNMEKLLPRVLGVRDSHESSLNLGSRLHSRLVGHMSPA